MERLYYAQEAFTATEELRTAFADAVQGVARAFDRIGNRLGAEHNDVEGKLLWDALGLRRQDLHAAIAAPMPQEERPEDAKVYPTIDENPQSWIGAYLAYTQQTEPDWGFHFWSAVSILGAAMRRNFFFDYRVTNIYGAGYTFFIGDPGATKKSTSIKLAQTLLERMNHIVAEREAELARQYQNTAISSRIVKILPEKASAEHLLDCLAATKRKDFTLLREGINNEVWDGSIGFLGPDEFADFAGKDVPGAARIITFLTNFYGCPDEKVEGTRKGGVKKLRNVALTMLAGSTMDWIRKEVTPSMFNGGFLSRCLFVHRERRRAAYDLAEYLDPLLRDQLAGRLATFAMSRESRVDMTQAARKWWKVWYKPHTDMAKIKYEGPIRHYFARRAEHLLRLALILAVSERGHAIGGSHKLRPFIDECDLELGWRILQYEEERMPMVFDRLDVHSNEDHYSSILNVLRKLGGRNEGVLFSRLYAAVRHRVGDSETLRKLVASLIDEGLVREVKQGRTVRLFVLSPSRGESPDPQE